MLQTNTVAAGTLELLRRIMSIPELGNYTLAGGTALALQIGHRISVDLDFFSNEPINKDEIFELLGQFGDIRLMHQSKSILIMSLNKVKVDFVHYKYEFISPIVIDNGIRLAGIPDIGAMKLAAITGRGTKRDFTDLYFLLQYFSLEELVAFYVKKYPDGSEFLLARSLTYFADADSESPPDLLVKIDWDVIKNIIRTESTKLFG